jgi:preprotein translocase subunit SecE
MNKVVEFFTDVKKEAAKVTWPTRKETGITVMMVVVLSVVMALFFLLVDGMLAYAMRFIINIRL